MPKNNPNPLRYYRLKRNLTQQQVANHIGHKSAKTRGSRPLFTNKEIDVLETKEFWLEIVSELHELERILTFKKKPSEALDTSRGSITRF